MPRECAFSSSTANISGEHIWSDWMNPLFPGKKEFRFLDLLGRRGWSAKEINWKAKVVCKKCNETWMSEIENKHAKPAMADLITGKLDIPIPQSRANSIALFAFKTAVVVEYLSRSRPIRFFPRDVRHRFRETLDIPATVKMWMAAYLPRGQGRCFTSYHELPEPGGLELYVCTFGAGHFVFQVLAGTKVGSLSLDPVSGFEDVAVPFWPRIPDGFVWPARAALESVKEFGLFASRWRRVEATRFFGD
jgi:hypothetical protein